MVRKREHCSGQRASLRTRWLTIGGGALLGLLLLIAATRASATVAPVTQALTCPSGRVTWLRGTATSGSALLAIFAGAPVGGGSAGTDGAWAIPLTVRERPGTYPVTVHERQSRALVAAFTCYVDLPLGSVPTAIPTAPPTPTAAILSPTATLLPSATAQVAVTTSPSALPPSEPPNTPDPSPSATATPPATEAPVTPSPSPTASPSPAGEAPPLVLAAIEADDPEEPGLAEYIIVENSSLEPAALAGWRLTHREAGADYVFPALALPAGELLVIWSGIGTDDPTAGRLYWPTEHPRWTPGQTVELVDPSGRRVGALVVAAAAPPGP